MDIRTHEAEVPSVAPAFFLARTHDPSDGALVGVATAFINGPGASDALQVATRLSALAKDQSSLAALNVGGLLKIDGGFALVMGTAAVLIFVFGLLLQRRREYVTLKAQGMSARAIRALITAEAATAAIAGCLVGVGVGLLMAFYWINVLRPLFVLEPPYLVPFASMVGILGSVLVATFVASVAASSLVNRLSATELLRDE
jgi:ABC-type antimicrobial peptide transport system permease subunit